MNGSWGCPDPRLPLAQKCWEHAEMDPAVVRPVLEQLKFQSILVKIDLLPRKG
jgi:hypothetical protein